MSRARMLRNALLALLLVAAAGSPVAAQRGPGARGQQDRAELERRVRARFGEMVKARLGLTDEQAQALDDAVRGFQPDRMRLRREEEALRSRTEAVLLEGGGDAEALELLERTRELRAEENRLWQAEQERLLTVLTPTQVLRFHVLREEMGARIRRLRGGGPGGPPGMEMFDPER